MVLTSDEINRFNYLRRKSPALTTQERRQLISLENKVEMARAKAPGVSLEDFLKSNLGGYSG